MNTKWEEELNQFYMKNADYEGLSYNQIKAFIKSTLEEVINDIPDGSSEADWSVNEWNDQIQHLRNKYLSKKETE